MLEFIADWRREEVEIAGTDADVRQINVLDTKVADRFRRLYY